MDSKGHGWGLLAIGGCEMRYLLAYLQICVLGGMSLGGCSEVIGVDGQGGSGGSGTGARAEVVR